MAVASHESPCICIQRSAYAYSVIAHAGENNVNQKGRGRGSSGNPVVGGAGGNELETTMAMPFPTKHLDQLQHSNFQCEELAALQLV